jgi:hypothetical protein
LLIDWMDGDATAKDRLEDLAVEHPQDQGVVVTAALASADDAPAQGRYDSWILFLNPDAAGAGRVPVIIGPTSNDTAAFVRVGFGLQEQIYLRNGPLNAFPPGWLSIGYR